jgi:hypothetical protein
LLFNQQGSVSICLLFNQRGSVSICLLFNQQGSVSICLLFNQQGSVSIDQLKTIQIILWLLTFFMLLLVSFSNSMTYRQVTINYNWLNNKQILTLPCWLNNKQILTQWKTIAKLSGKQHPHADFLKFVFILLDISPPRNFLLDPLNFCQTYIFCYWKISIIFFKNYVLNLVNFSKFEGIPSWIWLLYLFTLFHFAGHKSTQEFSAGPSEFLPDLHFF